MKKIRDLETFKIVANLIGMTSQSYDLVIQDESGTIIPSSDANFLGHDF
jgi:hypothetical protein